MTLTHEETDALRRRARRAPQRGRRRPRRARRRATSAASSASPAAAPSPAASLLMFGFTPISWTLGVGALATAKILENMEIGHNVMHGQYDWMNDPDARLADLRVGHRLRLRRTGATTTTTSTTPSPTSSAATATSATACCASAREQHWRPKHLVQPISNVVLAALFQWGVGLHDLDLDARAPGQGRPGPLRAREARRSSARPARQLGKDYVLFPLLALGNAPRVFAGNLAANLIRNVWTNVDHLLRPLPRGRPRLHAARRPATSRAATGTCASSRARPTSRAARSSTS